MNRITKVVFRCNNDISNFGGENSQNWYGEDGYMLGETLNGKEVTDICYADHNAQLVVVRVWTGEDLFCEIPWHSVSRVYYGWFSYQPLIHI